MKILFIHRNFPAQFRHLATYLAQDKNNEVVFLTNAKNSYNIPGVKKILYGLHRNPKEETHHYLKFVEESVLHGQGALRTLINLQKKGFKPDVIVGHSWGAISFVKDVYPDVPLIAHMEWFYNSKNSDIDFIKEPDIDSKAKTRYKNSHLLIDLYSCDKAITPTNWQLQQIPKEYHGKVSVIHEGIDTNYFKPDENAIFKFNGKKFTKQDEIITYATRGMEPYRGFPQFMEAASIIQKQKPNAHIIIAGEDRVCYGSRLADGKTFKQLILEKFDYDESRLHFTGSLPYGEYLKLLQVSSAHVYLTYPFVLSWSMLEAMACGCNLLASNTAPVKEVVQDEVNGLLFDFFKPQEIVERVNFILDNKQNLEHLRTNARQTIIQNYDLNKMLEKQLHLIQNTISNNSQILYNNQNNLF